MSSSALRPVSSHAILTALRKLGASISDDDPTSNFVSVMGPNKIGGAIPVLRSGDKVDPLSQQIMLGALGYTETEFLAALPLPS
jgi:hypothetical protein